MNVNEVPDGVNQSEVASYNRCRYQHSLIYGQGIERRWPRPPMSLGTAIHLGVAVQLRGGSADEAAGAIDMWGDGLRAVGLMDEEEAALVSIVDTARIVAARTITVLDLGHRWDTVQIEGRPAVELHIELPFTAQVRRGARDSLEKTLQDATGGPRFYERRQPIGKYKKVHGTVDWVAREAENGAIWLIDHKCYSSFQPIEAEETNEQMAVYAQLLWKRYGLEPGGSITHQIRPEKPHLPKLNQDGSMSRTLITTDWPTYRAALLAASLDPGDYEMDTFKKNGTVVPGMRAKLDAIEFWRMSRAYRNRATVEANWRDVFLPAVREMAKKDHPTFRTISPMNCQGCTMRELCLENLRAQDTSFMMRTTFKLKSEPDQFDIPVLEE